MLGAKSPPTQTSPTDRAKKMVNVYITATNKGNVEKLEFVDSVVRVYEPDHEDKIEILYKDKSGQCLTAFIRDNRVMWIAEGW